MVDVAGETSWNEESSRKKTNEKALKILGTTETKMRMMNKFGLTENELDAAVEQTEVALIEAQREESDQRLINQVKRSQPKCLSTLGYDPSYPRLMRQLGLTLHELEEAIEEGRICREEFLNDCEAALTDLQQSGVSVHPLISLSEKNAILESQKLQKLLGVAPRDVRLMRILGIDETELHSYLNAQAQQSMV